MDDIKFEKKLARLKAFVSYRSRYIPSRPSAVQKVKGFRLRLSDPYGDEMVVSPVLRELIRRYDRLKKEKSTGQAE